MHLFGQSILCGNTQSTFFLETLMDALAEGLKLDPVEFRIRNANRPNEETPQGLKITSCGLKESLEAVAARADAARMKGEGGRMKTDADTRPSSFIPHPSKKRGIGFASTLNVGGGARIYRSDGCGAIVKVDDFGHVSLVTGSTEIGQGSETVLAQIVADTLGVDVADVSVENSDQDLKPW